MSALTAPLTSSDSLQSHDYGWFGWNVARGTAVWSGSVHRLHGYEPGQVIPSSALTFHHKHPADLYECIDALHAGMVTGQLVVHEHRLVDANGQIREVVAICRSVANQEGRSRNLRGFLLPTDAGSGPVGGGNSGGATAPLIPVVMNAFGVSDRAARVLVTARRPMTMRRSSHHQDFARRYAASGPSSDLRSTLEDSWFPLEHLTLGHLEALDLAA